MNPHSDHLPVDGGPSALAVLQALPVAYLSRDAEGRITQVSPQWEALVQRAGASLLGRDSTKAGIFVPSARALAVQQEQAARETRSPVSYNCELVRADGLRLAVRRTLMPLPAGQLFELVEDLSAADAAQKALQQRELEFRQVLDQAPDMVVGICPRGLVDYWNPKACQMSGHSAADAIGRPLPDLLLPERHRSIWRARLTLYQQAGDDGANVESGEQRNTGELEVRRANGEEFVMEYSMQRIAAVGGWRLVVFARDVTERRVAAQKLQATETYYRSILEFSPGATLVVSEAGRIRNLNVAMERLFGYASAQLLGQPLTQLIPAAGEPDFLAQELQAESAAPDGPRPVLSARRHNGQQFPVALELAELPQLEAGVRLFAVHVRDLEVEQRYHQKLREAARMAEEANRSKSDFLVNMSHEIRTPMNAIIGLAHLALKGDMPTRQRDFLRKIEQSSQHLLGIINDILDFSKVDAGKLEMECIAFSLEQVLENVVNVIADKAQIKGLELICDLGADVPVHLLGDPLRLGQILINYANNAIKFTAQGEVAITVRLLERDDGHVLLRFEVRDTGIGLSDVQIARLFQSFSQADSSITRQYGGTGLGLAICKSLSQMMGGEVGVTSAPGVGSTFWCTARLGLGTPRDAAPRTGIDVRGCRVLVVDDNLHAAQVLSETLKALQFEVQTVHSGAAAIAAVRAAAAQRQDIDVVLMDWQMPGMDGLEAARSIQALGLAVPPRQIMVSAYGREEVRKGAATLGIPDVLTKPIGPSLLFDTLIGVLGLQAAGAAAAAEPSGSPSLKALAAYRGTRVLLVDDNELNQLVGSELLQDAGFVVDVAEHGQQAVDLLQRGLAQSALAYALVLMDMQMPVMDGITATQVLRADPAFQALPILAVTANARDEDRQRCLQAGMQGFISKPIDPDALWLAMLQWLPPPCVTPEASAAATIAAAPSEPGLPQGIAGLDTALGLSRVMGKRPLYLNLLRKFASGQAPVPQQIEQALAQGDWTTAQRLAHTLKGVCGNIGATALQQEAAQLEAELHAQRAPGPLLQAVALPLRALVEALQAALPSEARIPLTPAANDPAHQEALRETCQELLALLASDDAEALELMLGKADVLRHGLGAAYDVIHKAVSDYEFGSASDALRRVMAQAG